MSTLVYPSPDFPGLPSVALEVPDGWEPAHAPGTTLAARLPREGAFAPNVVVSIEACPPSYDVETILQANLLGVVTSGRPDVPGHLVQLTGAVGGPDAEGDHELVRSVLTTVRARPWTPEAEGAPQP